MARKDRIRKANKVLDDYLMNIPDEEEDKRKAAKDYKFDRSKYTAAQIKTAKENIAQMKAEKISSGKNGWSEEDYNLFTPLELDIVTENYGNRSRKIYAEQNRIANFTPEQQEAYDVEQKVEEEKQDAKREIDNERRYSEKFVESQDNQIKDFEGVWNDNIQELTIKNYIDNGNLTREEAEERTNRIRNERPRSDKRAEKKEERKRKKEDKANEAIEDQDKNVKGYGGEMTETIEGTFANEYIAEGMTEEEALQRVKSIREGRNTKEETNTYNPETFTGKLEAPSASTILPDEVDEQSGELTRRQTLDAQNAADSSIKDAAKPPPPTPPPSGGMDTAMAGSYISSIGQSAATTIDFISNVVDGPDKETNYFADYANRTLAKIDEIKRFAGVTRKMKLADTTMAEQGARAANRGTARGIGSLRALDLGIHIAGMGERRAIESEFATDVTKTLGMEADTLLNQDATRMGAETDRAEKEQMNKDTWKTNFSQSLMNIGSTAQNIGRNMNAGRSEEMGWDVTKSSSKYLTSEQIDEYYEFKKIYG